MSYSSNRPYLIQAMLAWIADNNLTPYILVDAQFPTVVIPQEHVVDGRIVLNIAPDALRDFMLSDKLMTFHAGFSGQRFDVYIPLGAIEAIYPHETGEGVHFQNLDKYPPSLPKEGEEPIPFQIGGSTLPKKKKPHLSIVRIDPSNDKNPPSSDK